MTAVDGGLDAGRPALEKLYGVVMLVLPISVSSSWSVESAPPQREPERQRREHARPDAHLGVGSFSGRRSYGMGWSGRDRSR